MNGEDIKPSVSAGGSSGDLRRAWSTRTAFGVFGIIIIIGGSLVSFGVLAFLFYLWLGNLTNARFDYPLALSFLPAFTPFGEVTGPANTTPTDRGLSDTGSVYRVYLPLTESNGTTVQEYDGKIISFVSRFLCMRPKLVGAGVEQIFQNFPASDIPGLPAFSGNISYQASFDTVGLSAPPHCQGFRCFSSSVNCTSPSRRSTICGPRCRPASPTVPTRCSSLRSWTRP